MRFGAGVIAHFTRWRPLVLSIFSAVFVVCGLATDVRAEGSSVRAVVNSGTLPPPALALTDIVSPHTVKKMPLSLKGTESSLTQIQVYVNDVFSVTIPLDEGAEVFEYDLVIPSGTHAVKLVGISPFADISPTVTLSVTYAASPGGSDDSSQPTTSTTISPQGGGAVISRNPTSSASTAYITPTYASSLPSWFYNGLLALDIARPDDTEGKELAKTVQRIVLASSGLFLFTFAQPALALYRTARYSWLGFNKRPLPRFMRNSPMTYIRLVGALLIAGVFWFI